MSFVNGLVPIFSGALCIPSLVVQKIPKAKNLLDKVVSFRHIVGGIAILWGIVLVLVSPIMSLLSFDYYYMGMSTIAAL